MTEPPALVWLSDDLRLDDQPALAAAALDRAQVRLGRDDPAPIVGHDFAPRRALAAFAGVRK